MLHFMTGLFKTMFSDEEIHILIIGHEGAGKTTFLEQLKCMYARETNSTSNANNTNRQEMAEGDNNTSRNSINTLPHPAEPSTELTKRIRPTIGVNLVRLTHYFSQKGEPTAISQNINEMHNEEMMQKEETRRNAANQHHHDAIKVDHIMSNTQETNYTQQHQTATHIANPYAGRSERTHLLLWDVGGAHPLRSLWAPYFPQCHGVIYVIDSTLPFTLLNAKLCSNVNSISNTESKTNNTKYIINNAFVLESNSPDRERHGVVIQETAETSLEHDTHNSCKANGHQYTNERSKYTPKELYEIYRGDKATLQRLLLHPELESVPFLVLSNKADCPLHVSLSELQDALGVVDWALFDTFYNEFQREKCDHEESSYDDTEEEEEEEVVDKAASNNHAKQMNGSKSTTKKMKHARSVNSCSSSSSTTVPSALKKHRNGQKHSYEKNANNNNNDKTHNSYAHSKCGFGKITWKLAEISALSGLGVSSAMDWLVAQLIEHHRQIDDGGDNKKQ